jgi:uncharacterized Ntn-hydrolase superfamily protein
VTRTEDRELSPYYDDLRVDATETPIRDLRETFSEAERGFEMAVERYADAYEDDDIDAAETSEDAADDADNGIGDEE